MMKALMHANPGLLPSILRLETTGDYKIRDLYLMHGFRFVDVYAMGGGGGGGAGSGGNARYGNGPAQGGGGGGGGSLRKVLGVDIESFPTSLPVIVGPGGTAGVPGPNPGSGTNPGDSHGGPGGDGGNTVFWSLANAFGGGGGGGARSDTYSGNGGSGAGVTAQGVGGGTNEFPNTFPGGAGGGGANGMGDNEGPATTPSTATAGVAGSSATGGYGGGGGGGGHPGVYHSGSAMPTPYSQFDGKIGGASENNAAEAPGAAGDYLFLSSTGQYFLAGGGGGGGAAPSLSHLTSLIYGDGGRGGNGRHGTVAGTNPGSLPGDPGQAGAPGVVILKFS